MHPDTDTYLPWFILKEIPAIGNHTIKHLIRAFKTPEAVLAASKSRLREIPGISRKAVQGLQSHAQYTPVAQKELTGILEHGFRIVCLTDPEYPVLLKKIPDPPPVLTLSGTLSPIAPCIAIVGSRNATSYGLNTARYLSGRMAEKGFTIVSGMARGIDAAAHLGALDTTGRTIAVLGSGLKKIYPKENRGLFYRIPENGAVLSEFKLDTDPYPYNFPVRNRIIAGLSAGTIVVEAEKKSGSLITATLALDYNREVFAVPGSIKSKKSQGTHALLKSGAKLVESETDILDELNQFVHPEHDTVPAGKDACRPPEPKKIHGGNTDNEEIDTIYRLLEPYPRHIDQIIAASRMDAGQVSAILLELELAGRIQHHPGNYFSVS